MAPHDVASMTISSWISADGSLRHITSPPDTDIGLLSCNSDHGSVATDCTDDTVILPRWAEPIFLNEETYVEIAEAAKFDPLQLASLCKVDYVHFASLVDGFPAIENSQDRILAAKTLLGILTANGG